MDETFLIGELGSFAKGYKDIIGISRGNDPEEGGRVYYFLGPGTYDSNLEDELSDLSISLFDKGFSGELFRFPVSLEYVAQEPFLGEIIWRRD